MWEEYEKAVTLVGFTVPCATRIHKAVPLADYSVPCTTRIQKAVLLAGYTVNGTTLAHRKEGASCFHSPCGAWIRSVGYDDDRP